MQRRLSKKASDFRLALLQALETPEQRQARHRREQEQAAERSEQRLRRELRRLGLTDEEIEEGRRRIARVISEGGRAT